MRAILAGWILVMQVAVEWMQVAVWEQVQLELLA
jgi:hypothetical protein